MESISTHLDIPPDSSTEGELVSQLMIELFSSSSQDSIITTFDKIFQKLKVMKVDKIKKNSIKVSNSTPSTPTKIPSSSSTTLPPPIPTSSPSLTISSSTTNSAYNSCYEEELLAFANTLSVEGTKPEFPLLIFLLSFTKSILLNFIQDKMLKIFILSSKNLFAKFEPLTSQQEEILTQALNSFISIEEPVSNLVSFLSPNHSQALTPASSPITSSLPNTQFSISTPIVLQDLISTIQKESIEDNGEDASTATKEYNKEISKKASTTQNFLKSFLSTFFFLLENSPFLLSLRVDESLLEKFFFTLIDLDLPRYAIRIIQFYPEYFTLTHLVKVRDILMEKNSFGIISSAYVSICQVRGSLKNSYNNSSNNSPYKNHCNDNSKSNNSYFPEDMLKPEVISLITASLNVRIRNNNKRKDDSLISIKHNIFKEQVDSYTSLIPPLDKPTANRALLDLVIHAPCCTSVTLTEAKDLNFKSKLKSFVKKNKWVIASSFCKDHRSNLMLFDMLIEHNFFIEAKQLYESTPSISNVRPQVCQNTIDNRIEYLNSIYLRFPNIPVHIIENAADVHRMAEIIGVNMDSTYENFPSVFKYKDQEDHQYSLDVSLEQFFSYVSQGKINLSQNDVNTSSVPFRQIVSIDCEWPFDSQKGASILQLSISTCVFLIDMLRIGSGSIKRGEKEEERNQRNKTDLITTSRFINNIFKDPSILKVTFDFYLSDLKMIGMTHNDYYTNSVRSLSSFIDLKKIFKDSISNFNSLAEKESGSSLSNLANRYLGKPLNKDQQVSFWDSRPLTPNQISYAAMDSHVLLAILDVLLIESGSDQSLSLALDVYNAREVIDSHRAQLKGKRRG